MITNNLEINLICRGCGQKFVGLASISSDRNGSVIVYTSPILRESGRHSTMGAEHLAYDVEGEKVDSGILVYAANSRGEVAVDNAFVNLR